MCAMRNSRATDPTVLATHYRLTTTPRRVQPKRIERRRSSYQTKDQPKEMHPSITVEDEANNITVKLQAKCYNEHGNGVLDKNNDHKPSIPTRESLLVQQSPLVRYLNCCKKSQILPIKGVKEGLEKKQMTCKHQPMSKKDTEAISLALMQNDYVQDIDFEGNCLGEPEMEILSEVMLTTDYITRVRISENNIGSEGTRLICRAVSLNPTIVSLDLSGNDLTEKDAVYFKALLEVSEYLRELYLGHNSFTENGATMIGKALEKNKSLQVLDLSWNHIRLRGAVAFGRALHRNRCLEKLNLSWNGLYLQGACALGQALKHNDTLRDLDVTSNRFSEECISELLKGIKNNDTLEVLRFGHNHLTSIGAYSILELFKDMKKSGIKVLDFGNQSVHEKFETLLKEILQERDVQVIYGTVWKSGWKSVSSDDINEDELMLLNANPLTVIMECMRLQNFRLVELLKTFDTDNNRKLSIDELVNGLLKINIPLRRDMLIQFLHKVDKDGDGQLDYRELHEAQKIHRQKLRKYQQKNIPLEDTEIGRLSLHLQKMMSKQYLKPTRPLGDISPMSLSPVPSPKPPSRNSSPNQSARDLSAAAQKLDNFSLEISPRTVSRNSSFLSLSHESSPRSGNVSPNALTCRQASRASSISPNSCHSCSRGRSISPRSLAVSPVLGQTAVQRYSPTQSYLQLPEQRR